MINIYLSVTLSPPCLYVPLPLSVSLWTEVFSWTVVECIWNLTGELLSFSISVIFQSLRSIMHPFELRTPQVTPHEAFVKNVIFHAEPSIFSVLTDGLCLGSERVDEGALFGFGVRRKQIVQVNERRPRRAQKGSSLSIRLLFLHCLLSCNKIQVQFYSKRCFLLGRGQGRRESKAEEKFSWLGLLASCWLMGRRWNGENGRKWSHVQGTI